MKTRQYYVNEVLPAYQGFIESLDSEAVGKNKIKSKAIQICSCLNNLVDYIFIENPAYVQNVWGVINKEDFRLKIENARPGNNIQGYHQLHGKFFGFIRDISNISKHSSIGRTNKTINDLSDVKESNAIIRYQDEGGYYYSSKSMLIVISKDDSKIPLEYFIIQAFLFLTDILIELKIIPEKPLIRAYKRDLYVKRENANAKTKMSGFAGEYFDVVMSSYIYEINGPFELRSVRKEDVFNYTTNTSITIDKGFFPKN